MRKIIIAGAGGFGREILQLIKDINTFTLTWEIAGFINDIPDALDGYECSHSIIGTIQDWQPLEDEVFVCAIGNPVGRKSVVEKLKSKGASFVSLVHPTAIIGSYNAIGEGLIMYPYSKINVNCIIGSFVSIASSTNIGHDVVVGDFCAINAGSVLTGHVKLGNKVFMGTNSTIIPHVVIGDDVFIGAGSVVVSSINPGLRIMGNPARPFLPNISK